MAQVMHHQREKEGDKPQDAAVIEFIDQTEREERGEVVKQK